MNFSTLYREMFTSLIDAMHRKFDKNAQLSNQLKTWDHSVKIVDKFLTIAKIADLSRVFFFYLKVNPYFDHSFSKANKLNYSIVSEHTFLHQVVFATWNAHD